MTHYAHVGTCAECGSTLHTHYWRRRAADGALQWRDPAALERVKAQVDKGAKPQIRGRESCLFLEVGEGDEQVTVVL